MQNLIKNIRAYMNMNQSEFSKRLDVSFATVNRQKMGMPHRADRHRKSYMLCAVNRKCRWII